MKPLILFLLVLSSILPAKAQTVVLERDLEKDSLERKFGPNRTHFIHLFIGYGFLLGKNEPGAMIHFGSSTQFNLGIRYKLKLSGALSTGIEASYHSSSFKLKQEPGKVVPDTILHDSEKLRFFGLASNIYLRVNYGKRGDFVGKFVDFGGGFNWVIDKAHYYDDKQPDGTVQKVTNKGFTYVNSIYPLVTGRVGFNSLVILVEYRMTNIFTADANFPDLPRWTIGLQLGVH